MLSVSGKAFLGSQRNPDFSRKNDSGGCESVCGHGYGGYSGGCESVCGHGCGGYSGGCESVRGHSLDIFAYLPPSSEFAVNVELVTSGDASQV